MFKISTWQDYTVYQKNFSSLSNLNLYLLSDPIVNSSVFGNKRKIKSVNFDGLGLPYEKCLKYLIGGYRYYFNEIELLDESIEGIKTDMETESIRRYKKSPVGSKPNVVNYIAGSPLTMYTKEKYQDIKIVDVFYDIQCSWQTSRSEYLHRGIITYELIRFLEASRLKVNFVVFAAAADQDELVFYQISTKNPEERFVLSEANLFALCAPEMFRRIIFRVMESTPVKRNVWGENYGTNVKSEILTPFLGLQNNSILILNPNQMLIKGEDLEEDAKNFLKVVNLSNKLNINEEELKLIFKQKNM